MKTKIMLLALSLCAMSNTSIGQSNLGEVNKIKGFYVFTDCKPTSDYESLGEVKVDANDAEIKKSTQYQTVRDNLIKNARSVNYGADGLIITMINGGTDKAEIIKFKDGQKNKAEAKVEQYQGVYVFVDCKPVTESNYIGTAKKSGGSFSSPQYTSVRDALIKKCKKEFKDYNAIIFKFIDGGADMADAVQLK